jgi:glycosyltransferase involved in cell wall biosynthesis
MKNIKFSICIPNYNYGQYIAETIQSVLDQTYQNFEIIISDNASTDNSLEVINSYEDDRIRLVKNAYNIGYSGNVDKATNVAKGDFMILLLADDMLKPNALEDFTKLIDLYSDNDQDLVICGQIEKTHNNQVLSISGPKGGMISEKTDKFKEENFESNNPLVEVYNGLDIFRILMTTNFSTPGPVQATCYSRTLFQKVNGYHSPTVTIPDASFGHKICLMDAKIIYYSKPLAIFRLHDASFTADTSKMKNIKLLTDKYLLSLEFSDEELRKAGLDRKDVQLAFINHWCIKLPFIYLYTGRINRFYFHYIFGFASFPKIMLSQFKTYLLLLLSVFSPIFWTFRKLFLNIRR